MDRQKSLKGAARLGPNGAFELYIGGGNGSPKGPCISTPLREYTREYYDFLTSPDTQRQIGENLATKVKTQAGNVMVSFTFLEGFNVRLIHSRGEFATFILELPFLGGGSVGDDQFYGDEDLEGIAAYEEEDDA